MENKLSKQQARDALWRRGNLVFKCHSVQKEMYDLFYSSEDFSTFVWLLSRQTGKSTLFAILALEAALRDPNTIIKLITDTKIHVKTIFQPIFNELLMDCPEDIKPKYDAVMFCYSFPNGSQIQLAGSDGHHYEKLRGQKSKLILIDEAGFCDELEKMIESVLRPTTTHTGGKIVMASTPSDMPDHDFLKYVEKAEIQGKLVRKTIFDNPLLTDKVIQNIIDSFEGGTKNERFRREYMVEIIKDPSLCVIPEFNEEIEKQIVREWPTPPFFDCYESMDIGFTDLTVILFAYYDFRADKVIVQDEFVINGPELKLNLLTHQIKEKEKALWENKLTNETKKPYLRVSDINYIVQNELTYHSHGEINFLPAKKDDNEAALNTLRMLIGAKKIIIDPKCKTLIRHLKNVRWYSANNRTKFARSADDGHFDAVDALKYLVRHIIYTKNPYPAHFGMNMTRDGFGNAVAFGGTKEVFETRQYGNSLDVYKKIFNLKPRNPHGKR